MDSPCDDHDHDKYVACMKQKDLVAPMPWIGMYIAAASAICSLAMAVDAFRGFLSRKLWFPCKYFSLNATSLTVLAVTMKLAVDLTSYMVGIDERLARVSSIVFMSTALGNFMPSVASMDNNEILLNVTALGILVVTIAVNLIIYNAEFKRHNWSPIKGFEEPAGLYTMLLLLAILCSTSLVVPTAKRYLESKYREMHRIASKELLDMGKCRYTIDEMRLMIQKYWVMAETGNTQFVMARSVISATPGIMCLFMALTLVVAYVRFHRFPRSWEFQTDSDYKWSTSWISYVQSTGVALGTIAPFLRLFVAARFRILQMGHKRLRDELKVRLRDELKFETYWTSRLVEWRESSLPLQIRHYKCRKLLHDAKRLVLNVCIAVQVLVVLISKLVLIISAICGSPMLFCFQSINKYLKGSDSTTPNGTRASELDLNRYVLLLEGEPELPKKILTNICNEVDELIQIGKRKQPRNLVELLRKSNSFDGVTQFDDCKVVQSLHSQEPPHNWSLSLVTLASIAMALPNVTNHKVHQLLSSVSEGLYFVKVIERSHDTDDELASMRNAADVVWVGVELYHRWQNKEIQRKNLDGTRSYKEVLRELSDIAEKTITDFKAEAIDFLIQNPLNWPVEVIAANSMYRITQTILLAHKDDDQQTDEEMFERLSVMISEILAACLTNLMHTITLKCHSNVIKEREESVRQAAILLGEGEEILEILQQRELPSGLDQTEAASVDKWRFAMEHDAENQLASVASSSNETSATRSSGEHVSVVLDG